MKTTLLLLILLASSAQAQYNHVNPYTTNNGFVAGHMRGTNDGFEGNNMNYQAPTVRPVEIAPPTLPQLHINTYNVDPDTGVIEVNE